MKIDQPLFLNEEQVCQPCLGDFLAMMEEAMGIMPIVFVLIILLFGFDSTGQVKTRQQRNRLRAATEPLRLMQ